MEYQEILYAEDGPVGTITLNRPDDGNMFTPRMCHEIRDCIVLFGSNSLPLAAFVRLEG